MTDIIQMPHGPCFPDLRGKVALVTGGGSGIGRGMSLRLAEEGMHVFLCGRTEESLLAIAEQITSSGGKATPIVADVASTESIDQLFARIREEAGQLDTLVHNAAYVLGGSFEKTDAEYWRQMMATNIDSAFFLAKQCAELMIPRRAGSIIFISTIGALQAHHGMVAYDTSKGALDSFTRALALEFAQHNIRVNGIAPGAIRGHHSRKTTDPARADRDAQAFAPEINVEDFAQPYIPIKRYGLPAEIAATVAFLASGQASYITGQTICVDGGATAQLTPRAAWI